MVIPFFLTSHNLKASHPMRTNAKPAAVAAQTMNEDSFVASTFSGNILPEGDHLVTIESVSHTEASASELWNDRTPQLAVKYKNDDGVFTSWMNKRGYTKFTELTPAQQASGQFEPRGDDGYAVNIKTGNRVPNAERTASAMSIIGQLGTNALGLEDGVKFNGADLVGQEVGIHVKANERNKLRVQYTMTAKKVSA
jgi:hypothetical protein